MNLDKVQLFFSAPPKAYPRRVLDKFPPPHFFKQFICNCEFTSSVLSFYSVCIEAEEESKGAKRRDALFGIVFAAVSAPSFVSLAFAETKSATFANNDTTMGTLEEAVAESHALINKEKEDLERSISNIIEVQMKYIQDKIIKFEEVESRMEREWKQLHQMKNLLFADQPSLFISKN